MDATFARGREMLENDKIPLVPGGEREEGENTPVCKVHTTTFNEIGSFYASKMEISAKLAVYACNICLKQKYSHDRKFRLDFYVYAPELPSSSDFRFQTTLDSVAEIRAWVVNWLRGGLHYGFFSLRNQRERELMNEQPFLFIFSSLAEQIETKLRYLID